MPTPTKAAEPKHPLVGRGLHWKGPDGTVKWQACVLTVFPSGNPSVGDIAVVQFFEWLLGDRTTQRAIPVVDLVYRNNDDVGSNRAGWVLYENLEDMIEHYHMYDKIHDDRVRAQQSGAAQ